MNEPTEKTALLKKYRFNIFLIRAFFACFAVVIMCRSYQLQILGNTQLNRLADTQYKTKMVVHPKRGTIYDRNGNPLAIDILVSSIGIHPHQIADKEKTRAALLAHTDITPEALARKFDSGKKFEWIQRRIPQEKGDAIDHLDLKGVQVVSEYRRFYPNQKLAGQLLGAVGYEAKALGGLELTYDKFLRSESTKKDAEKDARGRLFSPLINADEIHHDVHLTVDKNIQHLAEDALREGAIKHKVKSGFAIVMQVDTGEILAMANYPEFNPNTYWDYPMDQWKNHAALDVFEPGSTFKTLLMAAALASGKVRPNDRFDTGTGTMKIGKRVIHDHEGHGVIDAKTILQVASNIGVTKIAQKIGPQVFYDFLKRLGISQSTKIGFIGEGSGSLRDYKKWQEIEFSNISFGQGVSVTGLQMAGAYAAIANGGVRTKPLLMSRIVSSSDQIIVENTPQLLDKLMPEDKADALIDMLHSVTQTGGTATLAHIDGYLAAGKTGTAQKVDPETRAYAKNDYVSSFIGFAPAKAPEVVVYVVYDTPRANGYYGGVAAAPVFKTITQGALAYLGIAPTEPLKDAARLAQAAPQTETKAKTHTVDLAEMRKNRVSAVSAALKNNQVPDLRGLSLRKVLQITQSRDIDLSFKGSGIVIRQEPPAGLTLGKARKWSVELASGS